eukprot:COSAG05_NODE_2735_length_2712_cov_2.337543_2_plen_65_part_00
MPAVIYRYANPKLAEGSVSEDSAAKMRAKTWLLARFSSRVTSAVLMELREFSEVSRRYFRTMHD